MNWFTRSWVEQRTIEEKKRLAEQDGACEHVEKDAYLAHVVRYEKDSYGIVASWVCCKKCDDKETEREGLETAVCHDCSKSVMKKDSFLWRWYDFYAPQGDIPLRVCNACRHAPKHIERVRRDQEDYEQEFGQ